MPIGPDTTAGELHDLLAARGAGLMVRALAELERGALDCTPQPADGVTYAAKIDKGETRIDFARPAREVHNHVRGLSPAPGAWFEAAHEGRSGAHQGAAHRSSREGAGPPGTVWTTRSPSPAARAPCACWRCSAPASGRWPPPNSCAASRCDPAARLLRRPH